MISSAFLVNQKHQDFIKTGHGRLALTLGDGKWMVVGLIILLIGLIRIDLTVGYIQDWQILRDHGVIETYPVRSVTVSNDFLDDTTRVTVGEDVGTRSFSATLSTSNYTATFDENGVEVVNVIVDPENPTRMTLQSNLNFPISDVALTSALIIVGIILVISSMIYLYKLIRLNRNGEVIMGEITDIIKLRSGFRRVYNFSFQFVSPQNNKLIEGRGKHVRSSLENRPLPQLGMTIALLYVNDNDYKVL